MPFPSVDQCWTQCGGYCCGNFHGIGGQNEVVIPLFPGEDALHASTPLRGRVRYSSRSFTLPDGHKTSVTFLHCSCGGACQPHSHRPLICRLYPYFPVCDVQGLLTGIDACSLADIFYQEITGQQKCPVFAADILDSNPDFAQSLRVILQNPQNILFIMAINLVCQHLHMALRPCVGTPAKHLKKQETVDFGNDLLKKQFSMMLFTLSPWKTAAFRDDFQTLCVSLQQRYGSACYF